MSQQPDEHANSLRSGPLEIIFWGVCVAGTVGVFVLPPLIGPQLPEGMRYPVFVGWQFALLVYPLLAAILVWIFSRDARPRKKSTYRSTAILILIGMFIYMSIIIPARPSSDIPVKAKLHNSINAIPVRKAIGIACKEGTLQTGVRSPDLGLDPVQSYDAPFIRNFTVQVINPVEVILTYETTQIDRLPWPKPGKAIDAGSTLIYTGKCHDRDISWSISGTVPKKYLPRR